MLTLEAIVKSIHNNIDKQAFSSEIKSVLKTKKQRFANDKEYIESLFVNNGYLRIKCDNIIYLVSSCLVEGKMHQQGLFDYLLNELAEKLTKLPKDFILSNFKDAYNNCRSNIDKIDQMEFDYKFYTYYSSLLEILIHDYFSEISTMKIVGAQNKDGVCNVIRDKIFTYAKIYANSF